MSRHQAGVDAETQAIAYLELQGLRLVARNYRAGKLEIDVIMRLGKRFIFIEVKYRKNENFASILEQITPNQCQRIRTAARIYLHHHKCIEHLTPMRFDVVAIVAEPATVHWLQDAF